MERDGKLTPFVYIESERKINGLISLSDHSEIRLKGFIDRVDEFATLSVSSITRAVAELRLSAVSRAYSTRRRKIVRKP